MSAHPSEDGFREIQLNGKQLVFLFMAATVVSVVIFLFGVLVGRNVRSDRTDMAAAASEELPIADTRPPDSAIPTASPDLSQAAPPPGPVEDPAELARIERERFAAESGARPVAPPPADTRTEPAPAVPEPRTPPPGPNRREAERPVPNATSGTAASEGSGGYAVQLAALNTRSEADAMAKGMSAKGYQAYVQGPANGAPNVFRVRVGPFKTRREAEAAAGKLQKEEQFNPWVVRP